MPDDGTSGAGNRRAAGRAEPVRVLPRVNPDVPQRLRAAGALAVGAVPSPSGRDLDDTRAALRALTDGSTPQLSRAGMRARLAGGLAPPEAAAVAEAVAAQAAGPPGGTGPPCGS